MTVHIPVEASPRDMHRAAIDAVNRWRGHCVECYARLEFEVATTLSAMAATNSTVPVPHNFGDKVKRLRAAVDCGGPFAQQKLANAIEGLAEHLGRRNLLVHASGKVWVDGQGGWLWRYQFQPSGKGRPLESGCFDYTEALRIEKDLAREGQSLGGQMSALRKSLQAVTE